MNQTQAAIVAKAKLDGKSDVAAVKEAGFAASTANKSAWRLVRDEKVLQAYRDLGKQIDVNLLDDLSKARLLDILENSSDYRTVLQAVRTAQEMAGKLGASRIDLTLNQMNVNIPPQIQERLAARAAEIIEEKRKCLTAAVTVEAQ